VTAPSLQQLLLFLTWAMTSHNIPASQLPPLRFPQGEAITQLRRFTLLRRYISDDQPPARIRAAACLMLLCAQPLTRVLRLITRDDNGQIPIHLGHPPAPVPEPFASLLLQLTIQRQHASAAGTWSHYPDGDQAK